MPMRYCENCVCSDKLENDGKLHAIGCEPIKCDTYCPQVSSFLLCQKKIRLFDIFKIVLGNLLTGFDASSFP